MVDVSCLAVPFIKVEYFNPDDRWKVKRSLERGLSAPNFYHPDPMQYDPFGRLKTEEEEEMESIIEMDDTHEDNEKEESLQFNCFEAHIPYSMQFFKDWNLAGMSYIHISRGFFRCRMPQGLRPHYHQKHMQECDEERRRVPSDYLFLESNTPAMIWPEGELTQQQLSWVTCGHAPVCTSEAIEDLQLASNQLVGETHIVEHRQMKKETTCDVELDIVVHAINNVDDVMTALPSDDVEQEQTHWRAVPNLKQIWLDERSRMAKLLPPEHDFLSARAQRGDPLGPTFTLNVKGKGMPKSGTKLAVEGMKRLRHASHGLDENFQRAMKDIIQRYDEKVDKVDRLMSAHEVSSRGRSSGGETSSSPSEKETLDALLQMSNFINVESDSKRQSVTSDQWKSPASNTRGMMEEDIPSGTQESQSRSHEASQKLYSPQHLSQSHAMDDYEYSQRVERGEAIIDGDFDEIEDLINPETLRPRNEGDLFEDSEGEEDDRDETEIEEEMRTLATQTLEGNRSDSRCDIRLDDVTDIDEDSIISSNEGGDFAFVDSFDDMIQDSFNLERGHDKKLQQKIKLDLPPSRKQVSNRTDKKMLLKVPLKEQHPPWMRHLDAYLSERRRWARTNSNSRHLWFSTAGRSASYHGPGQKIRSVDCQVSLRCLPPLRKEVKSWTKKSCNRPKRERNNDSCQKSKRLKSNEKDDLMAGLAIDGNSRKLVAAAEGKEHIDDVIEGNQIEEVQWNASQDLSQATPVPGAGDNQIKTEQQSKSSHDGSVLDRKDIASPGSKVCDVSGTLVGDESALAGMGNQGGKLYIAAGGELKAKLQPSQRSDLSRSVVFPNPVSIMTIEIHVQSRMGPAGPNDSKQIAMVPDPDSKFFA